MITGHVGTKILWDQDTLEVLPVKAIFSEGFTETASTDDFSVSSSLKGSR